MKKFVNILLSLLVCLTFGKFVSFAEAQEITLTTNNGAKWRFGYYEGGKWIDYQLIFQKSIEALMDIGWIEPIEIPEQEGMQTANLWQWLAENINSNYIEFVADAHYTAGWDESTRKTMVTDIIQRLTTQQDIDLIFAVGTWAGQDLANNKHHTPTIVMSTTDAVGAGIITSIEDSGYDHVLARVDPFRYERQISIFYDIIGFQTLGIAYEDSVPGRSYAAIDTVEAVAQEFGFEIVSCFTKGEEETSDITESEESMKACFHELGKKQVDALYVTDQNGLTQNSLPELVQIINSYHIPTFAQSSSDYVKAGFLLSISQAGYKYVGKFYAETIAKILNGAKPRELEQIFEDPPKIAINLKTAEIIGYDPPVDVLGAADEIYQEIATP